MPGRYCRQALFGGIGLLLLLAACDSLPGSDDEEPLDEGNVVEGVDLDALFAPPTEAEIDAVVAEWERRRASTRAVDEVTVETEDALEIAGHAFTARVVSHTVDRVRHVGAVVTPDDAPLDDVPVLVYAHEGDGGVRVENVARFAESVLGADVDQFVYVIPSFRGETLRMGAAAYASEGPPSPWDRDVDDLLALLTVALERTPEANPDRIGILGVSRGAGVALLAGLRDERIDLVVDFFGPTDFFGQLAQDVVALALQGTVLPLASVPFLNETYIQPLRNGELTVDEMRIELVGRSPVYFTDRLTRFQLQVHHGTDDLIVPIEQSERLDEVMQTLNPASEDYEFFIYEGGMHDPATLPGSFERAGRFLRRLTTPALAGR